MKALRLGRGKDIKERYIAYALLFEYIPGMLGIHNWHGYATAWKRKSTTTCLLGIGGAVVFVVSDAGVSWD